MATPEEMAASMIANMPEKTGKDLDSWIAIVVGSKLEKHGEIVKFLKTEHGMTHGFANLVSAKAREAGSDSPAPSRDELVDSQYSGAKASLRPIYDRIVAAARDLGNDVEVSPKKSYVSLRRNKQFAILQPSTKTRFDLGLNLKGRDAVDRLEASGSFNSMVSHRVRLESADQVDAEVRAWLRDAYDAS